MDGSLQCPLSPSLHPHWLNNLKVSSLPFTTSLDLLEWDAAGCSRVRQDGPSQCQTTSYKVNTGSNQLSNSPTNETFISSVNEDIRITLWGEPSKIPMHTPNESRGNFHRRFHPLVITDNLKCNDAPALVRSGRPRSRSVAHPAAVA